MSEQYFTKNPQSHSAPKSFQTEYRGQRLTLMTDSGVFSYGELDEGTKGLLNALPELKGRVLDLGCGYGAIGTAVGKTFDIALTMSDVNERALSLAKTNLKTNGISGDVIESDGFENIPGRFDHILCNPPIRAGKAVIYRLFQEASRHLEDSGSFWLVIRKQQGAPSAVNYLKTLFSSVLIADRYKGFWIIKCEQPISHIQEGSDSNDI